MVSQKRTAPDWECQIGIVASFQDASNTFKQEKPPSFEGWLIWKNG